MLEHKSIKEIMSGVQIKQPTENKKGQERADLRHLSSEERDSFLFQILSLLDSGITPSGESYYSAWETGWGENLKDFKDSPSKQTLIPRYIRENTPVRFSGNLFMPTKPGFELWLLKKIKSLLFSRYFSEVDTIMEIGCGTGHHLIDCAEVLGTENKYLGLDWSKNSNELVNNLGKNFGIPLQGINFDMFNPKLDDVHTLKSSKLGIFTIGALEQLGTEWINIKEFLFELEPEIIIHLEPTLELYDENTLIDYLAIRYHKQKNWLEGYFSGLEEDANREKLHIYEQTRTFGSLFHEAYTLTVWKPK